MALDTSITSLYEYKVHERRNDIEELNGQICADWDYIRSLEESKAGNQSLGYAIKQEIQSAIEELRQTRDEMWNEVEEFAIGMVTLSNYTGKGMTEEELFSMLFDPLQAALQPILDFLPNLGLPEIPIIGNLTQIIKKISDMGRMIRRLPQEYVDAARKEAEEAKAAEKELAAAQKTERQRGMGWWDRRADDFKNSQFGKICKEIVDILGEVLHIIAMIAQNVTLFAILELIKLLKPVLDAFQIAVGTVVTLLENAYTLIRTLIYSSAQLLRYFYKMLEKKLTQLWDILVYVCSGGWSLPENLMISAAYGDIVCCNIEISGLMCEIENLDLSHSIALTDEQISAYQAKAEELAVKIKNSGTSRQSRREYQNDRSDIMNIKLPPLQKAKAEMLSSQKENDAEASYLSSNGTKIYNEELMRLTQQDAYLSMKQQEIAERKDSYDNFMREQEQKRLDEEEQNNEESSSDDSENDAPEPSSEEPDWNNGDE